MAEVDMIGLASRPVPAATFPVIQNRPLHSHQAGGLPRTQTKRAKNAADNWPLTPNRSNPEERARCLRSSGPSTDPSPVVLVVPGAPHGRCACDLGAESPDLTPPASAK